MNFNKLFRQFKIRLLAETVLKAALFATTISAASVFLISLFYHFCMTDAPKWMLGIVLPAVFSVSFIIYFSYQYPTHKKIAVRIDETGLQERVSTMLAFHHKENDILRLQRIDALARLKQTSPSLLRFHFSGKAIILCLVCVLLAITITRIPYDIWKVDVVDTGPTEEQLQTIEDLLKQLREEADDATLSRELQQQLNDMINQLETGLRNSDTDLEMVAQIENSRQQMKETLEKLLTQYSIGEALQRYELTQALGEAISLSDGNAVSSALIDLEILMTADNQLISTLSETINTALMDSGVSSEDELFRALNNFAVDLLDVLASEDVNEALFEAVSTAEEAILSALADQVEIEAKKNLLDNILAEAKDRILGINPDLPEYAPPSIDMPESQTPEGEGEMPEGGQPEGEMPDGEMPEDGQGEGEGEGQDEQRMIESIYDPISGNVSYGEVFAVYYAEYLKALEAGEVPAELQEIIDQYFSTLDQ